MLWHLDAQWDFQKYLMPGVIRSWIVGFLIALKILLLVSFTFLFYFYFPFKIFDLHETLGPIRKVPLMWVITQTGDFSSTYQEVGG